MRRPPVVAIVGVPNVGKSTLFNRLVGRRQALVGSRPGVTRDRIRGEALLGERAVTLVDTGGIFAEAEEGMAGQVRSQARVAVAEADAILLVVSAREGLTPADRGVAQLLRKSGRPTLLVVNKVDDGDADALLGEFHALGMGDPTAISAEHGLGIGTLIERVLARLPEAGPEEAGEEETRALAIVGRPNVGKSSLLNRLAREERAIVSEVPGTTRDSVDLLLEAAGKRYRIIDTAGIRRTARAPDPIDRLSMQGATHSLQAADVALLLIAGDEITSRDLAVGGLAQRFCRPLVIGVNKWDLAPRGEGARAEFRTRVAARFRFARFAPVLFLSAQTGLGLSRLFPAVEEVWRNGAIQVGAGRLNRLLQRLQTVQRPRTRGGRPMKCFYIAQTGVHPPAFTIFVNTSEAPHFAYRRFLENRIREEFGLHRTPIVLHWKPR